MPEVVISNTSPIFYLHRIRLLGLLQELYQNSKPNKRAISGQ